MSNTTALDAPAGGVGHLRLFAPELACPFKKSARRHIKSLEPLNLAFQQATGWELAIGESSNSYQYRARIGQVEMPPIPQISITDLSPALPPGMPAVSRIYCERLVDELNHLLTDLGLCQRQLFSSAPGRPRRKHTLANPGQELPVLESNLPFATSNLALTPLQTDLEQATCEWFIDGSGIARFAAIVCHNQANRCTRELIAARSTFLCECRHGASNRATRAAIQNTVDRLFSGDTHADVLTGTLNPLTGDITMVGSEQFQVKSTCAIDTQKASTTEAATIHLPRGQHLIFACWPNKLDAQEAEHWSDLTIEKLRGLPVTELEETFLRRLQDCIPSLPYGPEIALAISRP